MEFNNVAEFVPFWDSPDIRKVCHKICEGIARSGRWEELVDEVIHKGDGAVGSKWIMAVERSSDIYPLIGGKHKKKWFILVQLIDSNGKYSCQRFESSAGFNKRDRSYMARSERLCRSHGWWDLNTVLICNNRN